MQYNKDRRGSFSLLFPLFPLVKSPSRSHQNLVDIKQSTQKNTYCTVIGGVKLGAE